MSTFSGDGHLMIDSAGARPDPEADRWLAEHTDLPNAVLWNGAVGEGQRRWLDGVLAACDAAGERSPGR